MPRKAKASKLARVDIVSERIAAAYEKGKADGVAQECTAAYQRGKLDGAFEEREKFAPNPVSNRDLSLLVRHLEAASVITMGSKGHTLITFVSDEKGVMNVLGVPIPIFSLVWGELQRLGYGK